MRATLDRHDGPGKPDLKFARANLGRRNKAGDEAGNFVAAPFREITYDIGKMKGLESELYPATGKFILSARYEGGTITVDDSLTFGIGKIDKEAARVLLHELGHADLASRDFVLYLLLTAEDKTEGIKHDDRDVEKDAIEYERENCEKTKTCG